MLNISENVKKIRDDIAEAAIKSGRSPNDIKLVAASKMKPADLIMQAIEAGVDAVGENRVQEMLQKQEQGAYRGAPLHYIGHLQSNKVRQVVGLCDMIESVGSFSLLESIGKRAVGLGIVQDVLIEVNIGEEPQKSGILPNQTEEILEFASRTDGIKVLGLMSVPPICAGNTEERGYFEAMFHLFVDMSEKKYDNVSVRFLSMGMSESFTRAILSGSNMVRIGTAIFGDRA